MQVAPTPGFGIQTAGKNTCYSPYHPPTLQYRVHATRWSMLANALLSVYCLCAWRCSTRLLPLSTVQARVFEFLDAADTDSDSDDDQDNDGGGGVARRGGQEGGPPRRGCGPVEDQFADDGYGTPSSGVHTPRGSVCTDQTEEEEQQQEEGRDGSANEVRSPLRYTWNKPARARHLGLVSLHI